MIRPITSGDREIYLELCREFYHSPAVLHPVPEAHFARTFDRILAGSPFVRGYLLEQDGTAAGYALLAVTFSQEAGGEVFWIEELYLRPEFQGRGLGTELFRYLETHRPKTVARFRLELEPDNRDARPRMNGLVFRSWAMGRWCGTFPEKHEIRQDPLRIRQSGEGLAMFLKGERKRG